MFGRREQAKLATKAGKAAYRGAGAVGADRKQQARVAAKTGKTAYKGGKAARKVEGQLSGKRNGTRYLFYSLPVLAAGAVAAYLYVQRSRAGQSEEHHYQRPGDPNVTGADRVFRPLFRDGVAELRGPVPSRELKEAMVQIAGETWGLPRCAICWR